MIVFTTCMLTAHMIVFPTCRLSSEATIQSTATTQPNEPSTSGYERPLAVVRPHRSTRSRTVHSAASSVSQPRNSSLRNGLYLARSRLV